GAVGDHRLLGLAAPVGVEDVEREVVLLEEAGLVADLGDECLADAAPADRDLELVGGAAGAPGRARKHKRRRDNARMPHAPLLRSASCRRLTIPRLWGQRGKARPAG